MTDGSNQRILLSVRKLTKRFPVSRNMLGQPTRFVHAVNGIDLDLIEGETLGLVGESGCGKTTVGRTLLRLIEADEGTALFRSRSLNNQNTNQPLNVFAANKRSMRQLRRDMQIVFQDPFSSLNPRHTVATNIAEPLRASGMAKTDRVKKVESLLQDVGLVSDQGRRFPHELSGGQRQRVAIARAIALDPQFIVADEPVSSLDVSIQAQVLNLLADLQKQRGLTMLFIAHNLAVVRYVSHRIAVMYLGRIIEIADTDSLFKRPRHPYTQALIDAVPGMVHTRQTLPGEPPDPINPPTGCSFHPRCPYAKDQCRAEVPRLTKTNKGQMAACHFANELQLAGA